MGARAAGRSAWLVAPGFAVALLRSALTWPAPLLAIALATGGAEAGAAAALTPSALLGGALAALTSPRAVAILLGLALAGLLASAALRVAFLAGALPTLGEELARSPTPRPRFAAGVAYGFAPLLGAAVLGLVLELSAQLYAGTALLAGLVLALRPPHGVSPVAVALLGAGALTSAAAGLLLASLAADATVARAALSGEPPGRALSRGLARVLRRPAAFLLAALVLGAAGAAAVGSAEALEAAALGLASEGAALPAIGARLLAGAFVVALGALLDLWRLGTVAALACAEEPR